MNLVVGDSLDVESGEIYSPAIVLETNFEKKKGKDDLGPHIVVHYIGWEESYDEIILLEQIKDRTTTGGKHVKKCKAWAYLSPRFPVWPCILYVRPVKNGNKAAIKFLKQEKLMYIIPYGSTLKAMKNFRPGTMYWFKKF